MKYKFIFLFIIAMSTAISNAQVVFDPATYDPTDLPVDTMQIVNIDGTDYLQVVLMGWNSTIPLDPVIVSDTGKTYVDAFKCDVKLALGDETDSTFTIANVNTFLKLYGASSDEEIGASGAASTADFATRTVDVALWDTIETLQIAGQITSGGWPEIYGDTLWIGKIELINAHKILLVDYPLDVVNITDDVDYSVKIQATWSVDSLFLDFMVKDDIVFNDGRASQWEIDNVELYLDMDNSKLAAKDANDYQLRLIPDSGWVGPAASDAAQINGVNLVYSIDTADDGDTLGYTFNLSIPWDSAAHFDFDAVVGTQIGFDIDASDNDGVPSYRDQLSWNSPSGDLWNTPNYWGVLELAAGGQFDIIADHEAPSVPGNLDTSNVTATSMRYTWDASTDNRRVAGYIISFNGGTADTIASRSYNATGLTAGTEYTFTVKAIDIYNNKSANASLTVTVPTESAVNNTSVKSLTFFPNPTSGVLTIQGDNALHIDVISLTGSLIMSFDNTNEINVSDLNNGVYILRVKTSDQVLTSRFVKK